MAQGQPSPTPVGVNQSMADVMKAQIKYLPQLTKVTGENILPYERQLLAAKQEIDPKQAALESQIKYDQYNKYAELMNSIDQRMQQANTISQNQLLQDLNKQNLANSGAAVNAYKTAAETLDPEFYKGRGQGLDAIMGYIGGLQGQQNGNISGGEASEIERNLNRMSEMQGLGNLNTSQGAIQGAQLYGNQYNQRLQQNRSALAQALSMIPQTLSSVRSGVDPNQLINNKASIASIPNVGSTFMNIPQSTVGMGTGRMSQSMFDNANNNYWKGLQYGLDKGAYESSWNPYAETQQMTSTVQQYVNGPAQWLGSIVGSVKGMGGGGGGGGFQG